MMDPDDPTNSWCTTNCGQCYRLCTTGGTHNGVPSTPGECVVIQLENRCGDGYGDEVCLSIKFYTPKYFICPDLVSNI